MIRTKYFLQRKLQCNRINRIKRIENKKYQRHEKHENQTKTIWKKCKF